MNMKTMLKYVGLCAGIAAMTFSVNNAKAADTDSTVPFTVAAPALVVTSPTPFSFGSYAAVNDNSGTLACIVMSALGVSDLTNADQGPGGARLLQVADTSQELIFDLAAGGIGANDLTFQIGNIAGTAVVTLTDGGASGTFLLDTWTFNTAAADAEALVLNSVTGAGTLTTGAGGGADFTFGATLCTDDSGTAYADNIYTGTVRISLNY